MIQKKSIIALWLSVICLSFPYFTDQSEAKSFKKWTDISIGETPLSFKYWPIECRLRKKTTANYSSDLTAGQCPRWMGSEEPRTYVRLMEVFSGYYLGGHTNDFSQHPIFTKARGQFFSYFKNPEIKPGQRTTCNDSDCFFRRIEFSVKGKQCQWIFYAPDYVPGFGTQFNLTDRNIPYALEIMTCHTSAPFTKEHIQMKPGKVTVVWPNAPQINRIDEKKKTDPLSMLNASQADSGAANNKTRLEQKCLYGDTNACKLLNSLTSKPKVTENDCPDGSVNIGKGQCLVNRKKANTVDGSNSPAKNVDRQTAMKSAASSGSTTEKRPIAIEWEGKESLIAGEVEISSKERGKISVSLPDKDASCSGTFAYTNPQAGIWTIACTSGEAASGTFKGRGSGKGSNGEGTDNNGRYVKFTIGAR